MPKPPGTAGAVGLKPVIGTNPRADFKLARHRGRPGQTGRVLDPGLKITAVGDVGNGLKRGIFDDAG